jgi:hypothetical protein
MCKETSKSNCLASQTTASQIAGSQMAGSQSTEKIIINWVAIRLDIYEVKSLEADVVLSGWRQPHLSSAVSSAFPTRLVP